MSIYIICTSVHSKLMRETLFSFQFLDESQWLKRSGKIHKAMYGKRKIQTYSINCKLFFPNQKFLINIKHCCLNFHSSLLCFMPSKAKLRKNPGGKKWDINRLWKAAEVPKEFWKVRDQRPHVLKLHIIYAESLY